MLEDGAELPPPSAPNEVVKTRDGEMLVLVTVADPRPRERINITVAAGELAKIDRAAEKAGMGRSAFMVAAAVERAEKEKNDMKGQRDRSTLDPSSERKPTGEAARLTR